MTVVSSGAQRARDAAPGRNPDPVAVVTGPSSGIGLAAAQCLAREGLRFVLVARRPGATADQIADRVSAIIRRPRTAPYVPRHMVVTGWAELLFGWVLDPAGPLHLRRAAHYARDTLEAVPNQPNPLSPGGY